MLGFWAAIASMAGPLRGGFLLSWNAAEGRPFSVNVNQEEAYVQHIVHQPGLTIAVDEVTPATKPPPECRCRENRRATYHVRRTLQ